jgi:hypothetical protein
VRGVAKIALANESHLKKTISQQAAEIKQLKKILDEKEGSPRRVHYMLCDLRGTTES